jgi:hypothetical protein
VIASQLEVESWQSSVVLFRDSAFSPFSCDEKVIECDLKWLLDKNMIRDGGRANRE